MKYAIQMLMIFFTLNQMSIAQDIVHVWEMYEISFTSKLKYKILIWKLTCGLILKVRDIKIVFMDSGMADRLFGTIVANKPGIWVWESGSSTKDQGLGK